MKLKISSINIPLKLKVLSASNITDDLFQLINPRLDIENNILLFWILNSALKSNAKPFPLLANKVMSTFFSVVHQKKISDVATCYKMMPSSFFKNIDFNFIIWDKLLKFGNQ